MEHNAQKKEDKAGTGLAGSAKEGRQSPLALLLHECRKAASLTLAEVSQQMVNILRSRPAQERGGGGRDNLMESSYISSLSWLERKAPEGKALPRKPALSRQEVTALAAALSMWGPEYDQLLTLTGHSPVRSEAEEREIQGNLLFRAVWVYTPEPIEARDENWRRIVVSNIFRKGVYYAYFSSAAALSGLKDALLEGAQRLQHEGVLDSSMSLPDLLEARLQVIALPPQFFSIGFAFYNPPLPLTPQDVTWLALTSTNHRFKGEPYCCGCAPASKNGAPLFFTVPEPHAGRLAACLSTWRELVAKGEPLSLDPPRQLFPPKQRKGPG